MKADAAAVVKALGSSLTGKVYLITGASNGIGLECAKALAGGGATIVLACRSGKKAQAAFAQVEAEATTGKVTLLEVDLGEQASVRNLAAAFLKLDLPLHALINNAGCNGVPSWGQHTPGIESQFAVNFLGHYLLSELLHEKLAATPGARLVNLASEAHRRITTWEPVPPPKETYDPLRAYAFSNLCRILWTREKAGRLAASGGGTPPYPVVCLHPGVAGGTGMMQHMTYGLAIRQIYLALRTELTGVLKGQSVAQIAACQTYCAIAPVEELPNGSYFNGNDNPKLRGSTATWAELKPLGTPCMPTELAQSDEHGAELFQFAKGHCGLP